MIQLLSSGFTKLIKMSIGGSLSALTIFGGGSWQISCIGSICPFQAIAMQKICLYARPMFRPTSSLQKLLFESHALPLLFLIMIIFLPLQDFRYFVLTNSKFLLMSVLGSDFNSRMIFMVVSEGFFPLLLLMVIFIDTKCFHTYSAFMWILVSMVQVLCKLIDYVVHVAHFGCLFRQLRLPLAEFGLFVSQICDFFRQILLCCQYLIVLDLNELLFRLYFGHHLSQIGLFALVIKLHLSNGFGPFNELALNQTHFFVFVAFLLKNDYLLVKPLNLFSVFLYKMRLILVLSFQYILGHILQPFFNLSLYFQINTHYLLLHIKHMFLNALVFQNQLIYLRLPFICVIIKLLNFLIFLPQFIFILIYDLIRALLMRSSFEFSDKLHDKFVDFEAKFLSYILNKRLLVFHILHEFVLCLSKILNLIAEAQQLQAIYVWFTICVDVRKDHWVEIIRIHIVY